MVRVEVKFRIAVFRHCLDGARIVNDGRSTSVTLLINNLNVFVVQRQGIAAHVVVVLDGSSRTDEKKFYDT